MTDRIEYEIQETSLGRLLVVMTERGICCVRFGSRRALLRYLRAEFHCCEVADVSGDAESAEHGSARAMLFGKRVAEAVVGRGSLEDLPLDVSGTRFQERVWEVLRRIPRGEVRSYSEVARALKHPKAVRAVAQACASNPVPLVTPCHRVIAKSGALGGYAFGPERKRLLLQREGVSIAGKYAGHNT